MTRVLKTMCGTLLLVCLLSGQQGYPPVGSSADPGSGSPAGPVPGSFPGPASGSSAGPTFDQGEAADLQHGVARVSLLGGDVNLQRNGSTEMVAAVVNAPLLSHDRLQTAPGSSAEVQLDGSTIVRMAQNSDVGFADLQAGRAELQFGAGTIIFRVLRESQLQTDIETPSIAIHPLGAADLRISVLENGSTQVTVRAGAAEIYGPSGTQRLEAPRSVLVRANASGPEFQDSYPPAHDELDDWSAGRDNELLSSASYQYTGGDMAGVADLDANGAWVGSQYGAVWAPRAPDPGWSPYSNGQWVDEPYYGWTWVDAEPWGWAPFHYGRWFMNGGQGWCWWPGARGFRHSWGPAFVGFLGFGGGGLGWVALAPFEGFHAWWGRGGYRGNGGFYSEHGRPFGGYQNAGFRGGAVGGSLAAFGGFRGRFNAVPRQTLAGATPIRGQLPVNGAGYRFQFVNRPAVANPRLASVAGRTYFQAPRSGFQASRSGSVGSRSSGGFSGSRPVQQYRAPSASAGPSAGWQRFGDPRTSTSSRQGFTSGQGESGWHSFGQPERARPAPQQGYRSFGNSQPAYRPAAPSYRSAPSSSYRAAPAPSYRSSPAPSYRSAPAPSYRSAPAPSQRSYNGGGGQSRGGQAPRGQSNSHGGGGEHAHGGGGSGSGHRR